MFFKTAFAKPSNEGQDLNITLEEDDPKTVDLYLHFVYTGKIPTKIMANDKPTEAPGNAQEYKELARLYCFGEKYQDVQLKNAVVSAMIAKAQVADPKGIRTYPGIQPVDMVYKGTSAGSLARKLLVDMHIESGREEWIEGGLHNKDFLVDLGMGLYRAKRKLEEGSTDPWTGVRKKPNLGHFTSSDYLEREE